MSTAVTPRGGARTGRGTASLRRLGWPVGAVLLTVVIAAARLIVNPRFYFADDTERGSFGQWWQLGEYLSRGQLPVLDPSAWQAGNYFAEGQWGILSPITWLIGITAHHADNPVVHTTIVKIAALAVFAVGMYLLSREFGAARPWAALAAVLAPAAGFSVYMDGASWSTGLFNSVLLPFAWWGLRRAIERGRSPIAYLIASFSLITIGYVFGVIVLVVLLVETLVRHLIVKDRVRILRSLAASAWGALWTFVVYLPGVLTAPVSERGSQPFANFQFLNADLSDVASVASPWTTATIHAWWGEVTPGPLMYIAWVLPLLAMVLPIPRPTLRRLIPVFIMAALMLAAVLAPSHLGPLRWPVRMMPYLVIAVLVIFAVAMSRAYPERIRRRGALVAVGVVVASSYVGYVNEMVAWRSILVTAAIQFVAIAALFVTARRSSVRGPRRATAVVAVAAMLLTAGIAAVQLEQFRGSPLPSVGMPDDAQALQDVLAGVEGDVIVAGDGESDAQEPESWSERLMANLWYLSPAPVSSLYTVLPYTTYAADLCTDLRGATCDGALRKLWSTDASTGEPVADLLSISAIVAMKSTYPVLPTLPDGWRLAEEGEFTWLIERDEPLPSAGGVVWNSPGTEVSVLEQSDTSVTFTVDRIAADGEVVLSRLEYPGYSVDGAEFADPLRGYLLTVDLSGVEPGDEITVRFLPPPFPVLAGSALLALVLGAGWSAIVHRNRLRVRRDG